MRRLCCALGLSLALLSPRALLPLDAPAGDAAGNPQEPLRLIVLVVVDQLRGDVLHRFQGVLGNDGLRRLSEGGVWYRNAHYGHAYTVTGPGHASIGTGAPPGRHGIVANEWFERASGAKLNCVGDGASTVVGTAGETGNASPVNLLASTFSDEWVLASAGKARAVGISGKDRGAILPVGRTGKAFWFSTQSGRMVSSTYYYRELPAWAVAFDAKKPADQFFKKDWARATPDDDGVPVAADDRSFEKDLHGMRRKFPHPLGKDMEKPESRFYEQVFSSIYGDQIVMDFALEALRALELGKGDLLDILSISLSSNDGVGHNFGPDSVEAKELVYGLDRQIARLLQALDAAVGPNGYLIALTADHGVAYAPESLKSLGYAAARFDSGDVLKRINRRLNFSIRYLDWSLGIASSGYYFDPDALRYGGKPPVELEQIVAEVIRATPGISEAFTRTDILSGNIADADLAGKLRAAYHPARSPDVYFVPTGYWIDGTSAATHGSPYSYDTHVPVIFYGAGLQPKEVLRKVQVIDIAPTLSSILGTAFPSASTGTPLEEVLKDITKHPTLTQRRRRL